MRYVDPVRNPYAPGAGQRPPELAGRDRELGVFDVVLERVARGRPERSLILTGLRGVGKTVLLNTLRSQAISRLWGTGKIEARPTSRCGGRCRPRCTWPSASSPRTTAHRIASTTSWRCSRPSPFAARSASRPPRCATGGSPASTCAASSGRADSGDIEIDLVELLTDAAGIATDVGTGIALFIDEMQDLRRRDVSALCAACHELSQTGAPLIVVGAGLPHLPAVLSAAKSYSERLFRYLRIDRLDRLAADQALCAPAAREQVDFEPKALDLLYEASGGYPYFVQAYGKATWDHAPQITDHRRRRPGRRAGRRGRAGRGLLRLPVRAGHPGRTGVHARDGGARRRRTPTRTRPCRRPRSPDRSAANRPVLSPARDALIKKGLIY